RQINRLLDAIEGKLAIAGGKEDAAKRADGGRLGRRGKTEQDCAKHGEDQKGEWEERRQESGKYLDEWHVHLRRRQLGREFRINDRAGDDIEYIKAREQEAGKERRGIQLDRRDSGRRRIDDEQDAR